MEPSNDMLTFFILPVFIRRGKDKRAELVLLDHGLYDFLPTKDRISLCRLYKAIINKDEVAMKTHANAMGVEG